MSSSTRLLRLPLIAGCSLLTTGCIPVLHTDNETHGKLRFIDDQSGAGVHRILLLTAFEDYFGLCGPEGPPDGQPPLLLGTKAHYFAQPKEWGAQQEFTFRYTVVALVSPLFFVLPVSYGGTSDTDGLLVIAPGYRTTYVPPYEVYRRLEGETAPTITMIKAEHPEEEISRVRHWLQSGWIRPVELDTCHIIERANHPFPLPPGTAFGFRLTPRERKTVREFLDQCARACVAQSTATRPTLTGQSVAK